MRVIEQVLMKIAEERANPRCKYLRDHEGTSR
jgi:hypothetical protein